MKLSYIVSVLILVITAIAGQSCRSADESLPRTFCGYPLFSRSDAQAQLDEILDSNAFVDLDMSRHVPTPDWGYTEYQIRCCAIFYRFYKKMRVVDNRLVVDGTAADINISERAFDHCNTHLVEWGNLQITKLIAEGYTPEDAVKKIHNVTSESIKRVRVLGLRYLL